MGDTLCWLTVVPSRVVLVLLVDHAAKTKGAEIAS